MGFRENLTDFSFFVLGLFQKNTWAQINSKLNKKSRMTLTLSQASFYLDAIRGRQDVASCLAS